jgi:hypothetical protein
MPEREYEDSAFYWVKQGYQWTIALRDYQRGPGDFVWFLPGDADPRPEDAFAEIGPSVGEGPQDRREGGAVSAIVAWLKGDRRGIYEGRYIEDTGDLFDAIVEEIERGTPFRPQEPGNE